MLQVDTLTARYGAVTALDGVSLSVGAGETVALLGANGAGKTTLLRVISGLHRPAAGDVLFDGRDITGMAPAARVKAGLVQVPERRRIFPALTVAENLAVGASARKSSNSEIDQDRQQVYDLFPRLAERRSQQGWSLSGGEQQMLALGRALMARPRCLLLDEPSLGLAPKIAADIYRHIADINAQGVTVLVVEQNAHLALSVASRGIVLKRGEIALSGDRDALLADPAVREAYLGG